MRKAYLKQYSNGYIKGRSSAQKGPRLGRSLAMDRFDFFQDTVIKNSKGEGYYKGGITPRQEVIEKYVSSQLVMQTDRLQRLKKYNKLVLQKTEQSTVTMFFSGTEVFLIEDFRDGSYRQSLQANSTERLRELFKRGAVPWKPKEG